ncbi:MAG: D-alanine--D-alanine ligase [Candidatus Omnitrophota bacterium]|jgi:D-alanine--D-alanine ligase
MAVNKFGRIGVLMGGPSAERKISLKSGKAVYEALRQLGLEVSAIDIKTENIRENIRLLKAQRIDCAFLALHGRFGEDGSMQGILDSLKIPYTGSGKSASRLAMDKVASRRILKAHGLTVPRYKVMERSSSSRNACAELSGIGFSFPLVVKPAQQGSSIGLSIVDKKEKLKAALAAAFRFDERVLIEEYIAGREVTVGILHNRALPVIEIVPKKRFFDYEAKYTAGLTDYIVPAKLEEKIAGKIKAAALSAHRLLGCSGCSRVDMILSRDNLVYVLEVNTIPGFTSTSLVPKAAKAIGIEFGQLCLKLIKSAYNGKA